MAPADPCPLPGLAEQAFSARSPGLAHSRAAPRACCPVCQERSPGTRSKPPSPGGEGDSQREPVLDRVAAVEAAAVGGAVHGVVGDPEQRLRGAGRRGRSGPNQSVAVTGQAPAEDGRAPRWLAGAPAPCRPPRRPGPRAGWTPRPGGEQTLALTGLPAVAPEARPAPRPRPPLWARGRAAGPGGRTHSPVGSTEALSCLSAV